jgi:hypothetical protein
MLVLAGACAMLAGIPRWQICSKKRDLGNRRECYKGNDYLGYLVGLARPVFRARFQLALAYGTRL